MFLFRSPHKFKYILTALVSLLSLGVFASSPTPSGGDDATTMFQLLLGLTTVISFLVLIAVIIVYRVVNILLTKEAAKEAIAAGTEPAPKTSFWEWFNQSMVDVVPIEQEADILLDHDYDGIKELDNHLPPWWKYLFYATIVFAGVYIVIYEVLEIMPTQKQEYQTELAQAAEARKLVALSIDETNVEFSDDADVLASGESIYKSNCAACHGAEGQGTIGPNLTDNFWIHGGDIKSVFRTVKYGVPQKGMISWQKKLTPSKIRDVSSYIKSIRGSNPPNPKAPQGKEEK